VEELVGFITGSVNLATQEAPLRARAVTVTTNFFRGLGIAPVIGRAFVDGEDRAGAAKVAVISDRLWREQLNAATDVLGATLRLNAEEYTVVGVLPESFWFPGDPQVVVPFAWTDQNLTENRGSRMMEVFARLRTGATAAAADAELKVIHARLAQEYPESNKDWSTMTFSVRDWMLGYDRTSLWLLAGAVLLVLIIGCVNVANLMLVRGERRQREFAVRVAMGASRRHLAGEFVLESLVLAAFASALGIGVAWTATRVLLALFGGALPRADQVGLGIPVVAFAGGLALLTGLIVGIVPALRTDTRHLYAALRAGAHGMARGGSGLQRTLVSAEVALAVLLAMGAGLLLNSFWRLNRVETGIDPRNSLTFQLSLPAAAYASSEEVTDFYVRALDRIHAIAGVQHAGITERIPLLGGYNITTLASPDDPELVARFVEIRRTTPGFFPAAGIPLLSGRLLTEDDARNRAAVVVISDELASTIFPNGDAIGKRIDPGWGNAGYDVVGIVGSVRDFGLTRDERPAFYWPYTVPDATRSMVFIVRTRGGDPLAVVPNIRAAIAELDPTLPIYDIATMEDIVIRTVGNRRFATSLFAAFGVLALALAALGIFGVLAYAVEQRTREVGIRMALGASTRSVTGMVVAQGLRLTSLGLVVGVVGALFASRLLSNLLWEVKPADPMTFFAVALVSLATALAAAYLPARRAARIDPARLVRQVE
jgi:predicted permease